MHQIKIAFSFCTQVLQVKHFNFLLLLVCKRWYLFTIDSSRVQDIVAHIYIMSYLRICFWSPMRMEHLPPRSAAEF